MAIPIGPADEPSDLAAAVFTALAEGYFGAQALRLPFHLRDKRQTQDDPFDEHVKEILERRLPGGVRVIGSGKPLVSPDLVVARPEETQLLVEGGTDLDTRRIVAIEVKKMNASTTGRAARATGIDYNSTPPCSTVKVHSASGRLLRVPAFYLFVILGQHLDGHIVHTLTLVTGAALNQDTELYDRATGIRQKSINLGTFGDGLDRQRPMFVFANPLGWDWLSGEATLIHDRDDLADEYPLVRVTRVQRRGGAGQIYDFWCYRP